MFFPPILLSRGIVRECSHPGGEGSCTYVILHFYTFVRGGKLQLTMYYKQFSTAFNVHD